jgi:hypothetical protein
MQPRNQGYAPAPAPYPPPPAPYGYGPPQPMMQQVVVVQQAPPIAVVVKRPFNHTLHLIITICTCGAWLPVWIILAILD